MASDPQIPPPPWQRAPERPARRRRDPISRDAIVTAAIQLLDREGLAALSMRKLADELGAGAASLYWHVGSKDGLLDLVMDEVIGEGKIPDPEPDRWQEQIKQVARDQRAGILRHPWIVRVSIGRIPMGPNALRYSERILAILRAGGLPPRLAVQGYLLLIATINGFTIDETGVDDSADPAASAALTDPDSPPAGRGHGPRLHRLAPRHPVPQHDRPGRRVRPRRPRRALQPPDRHLRRRPIPPRRPTLTTFSLVSVELRPTPAPG